MDCLAISVFDLSVGPRFSDSPPPLLPPFDPLGVAQLSNKGSLSFLDGPRPAWDYQKEVASVVPTTLKRLPDRTFFLHGLPAFRSVLSHDRVHAGVPPPRVPPPSIIEEGHPATTPQPPCVLPPPMDAPGLLADLSRATSGWPARPAKRLGVTPISELRDRVRCAQLLAPPPVSSPPPDPPAPDSSEASLYPPPLLVSSPPLLLSVCEGLKVTTREGATRQPGRRCWNMSSTSLQRMQLAYRGLCSTRTRLRAPARGTRGSERNDGRGGEGSAWANIRGNAVLHVGPEASLISLSCAALGGRGCPDGPNMALLKGLGYRARVQMKEDRGRAGVDPAPPLRSAPEPVRVDPVRDWVTDAVEFANSRPLPFLRHFSDVLRTDLAEPSLIAEPSDTAQETRDPDPLPDDLLGLCPHPTYGPAPFYGSLGGAPPSIKRRASVVSPEARIPATVEFQSQSKMEVQSQATLQPTPQKILSSTGGGEEGMGTVTQTQRQSAQRVGVEEAKAVLEESQKANTILVLHACLGSGFDERLAAAFAAVPSSPPLLWLCADEQAHSALPSFAAASRAFSLPTYLPDSPPNEVDQKEVSAARVVIATIGGFRNIVALLPEPPQILVSVASPPADAGWLQGLAVQSQNRLVVSIACTSPNVSASLSRLLYYRFPGGRGFEKVMVRRPHSGCGGVVSHPPDPQCEHLCGEFGRAAATVARGAIHAGAPAVFQWIHNEGLHEVSAQEKAYLDDAADSSEAWSEAARGLKVLHGLYTLLARQSRFRAAHVARAMMRAPVGDAISGFLRDFVNAVERSPDPPKLALVRELLAGNKKSAIVITAKQPTALGVAHSLGRDHSAIVFFLKRAAEDGSCFIVQSLKGAEYPLPTLPASTGGRYAILVGSSNTFANVDDRCLKGVGLVVAYDTADGKDATGVPPLWRAKLGKALWARILSREATLFAFRTAGTDQPQSTPPRLLSHWEGFVSVTPSELLRVLGQSPVNKAQPGPGFASVRHCCCVMSPGIAVDRSVVDALRSVALVWKGPGQEPDEDEEGQEEGVWAVVMEVVERDGGVGRMAAVSKQSAVVVLDPGPEAVQAAKEAKEALGEVGLRKVHFVVDARTGGHEGVVEQVRSAFEDAWVEVASEDWQVADAIRRVAVLAFTVGDAPFFFDPLFDYPNAPSPAASTLSSLTSFPCLATELLLLDWGIPLSSSPEEVVDEVRLRAGAGDPDALLLVNSVPNPGVKGPSSVGLTLSPAPAEFIDVDAMSDDLPPAKRPRIGKHPASFHSESPFDLRGGFPSPGFSETPVHPNYPRHLEPPLSGTPVHSSYRSEPPDPRFSGTTPGRANRQRFSEGPGLPYNQTPGRSNYARLPDTPDTRFSGTPSRSGYPSYTMAPQSHQGFHPFE
eukprot:Hpha_TRINITY_DN15659_c3_g8::TRINITY_DN15659_c3_g8_i1::g.101376::m.101376